MSIQSEIDRIKGNVTDSLSAIRGTGVNVPDGSNSNDLPNLINDLANTRQRVVDFTDLSVTGPDSNGMNTILLTNEDKQQLFSDENPPTLLVSFDDVTVPFLAGMYKMEQQVFQGFIAEPYDTTREGPFGFAIVTCFLVHDTLYINQDSGLFVDRDQATFTVPVQLPADPTSALQAATKQYVDDKTDDAITTNSGGVINMGQSIGTGPYTIEMTEEEEGDLTAAQVSYNNVATDMTATDVQSAITELFTSASEGKALVAAAVTGKGVQTAADASYEQIAANVTAIETGGGTSNVSVNPNQWFVNGVSSISIMYQNPDGNSENRLVKENSSFSIQVMKGSLVAISVYAYSQHGGYFYPSVNGSSLSTTLIANPDRYTRISSTQFIADGDTMTVT